ncbi:hypothetical protein CLHOM_00220 [Clostridium homopropionicum DSM 5847]|uniref:NHL repeat protein n=1 Tax=Clostridium homopropionicum DSM 5847 TaxID=1121318 RepID=A0A0L6ZFI4_9CLOT|nr:hypothetical protein [Clostridium homopropionicum]KOA21563.1 hypothetical protein CLHOM_00220 [Clostridium homopropionicum DSM 5847]SFG99914.1 hypothetical protein SAMN04488501_1331 [Clostridium homopropionicum]
MKLISEKGWSIVPKDDSFLYHEISDRGEEIGYFSYSFDNICEIDKDTYSKWKFGLGYKNILKFFNNHPALPSYVTLEDGSIIATEFKGSYIHKFDKNGNLLWINDSMCKHDSIYSIAFYKNFLWCVYPVSNMIKKFSLNSFGEEISIGERTNGIFNYPESAIVYDHKLYICDMGNYRICTVDLATNQVKEYLKFTEPTWEYFKINGKEIVRLQGCVNNFVYSLSFGK